MKTWSAGRLIVTVVVGAMLWAIVAAGCLMVGSSGEIGMPRGVIYGLRLNDVLLASLVGAALAAAGVTYQAILRNPLADPYLLGVSSGAMLFSYAWQFQSLAMLAVVGQQMFAFAGALAAVSIVLGLSSRRGRLEPVTLLLVGVIVNAVAGSIFLLLNALIKDPATPGGPLTFLVGGLQTTLRAEQKYTATVLIGVGWFVLMFFAGELNVAVLSEAEAKSLGVRIQQLRWVGLIVASLVTAAAVAISGPIGFIGLVCPHLCRLIVGNDQRRLLPLATAMGAALLAVADAASRRLAHGGALGTALSVGVLTGLLGGPFFLILLWQSRRRMALAEAGQ